jgi:hypothetical protein
MWGKVHRWIRSLPGALFRDRMKKSKQTRYELSYGNLQKAANLLQQARIPLGLSTRSGLSALLKKNEVAKRYSRHYNTLE